MNLVWSNVVKVGAGAAGGTAVSKLLFPQPLPFRLGASANIAAGAATATTAQLTPPSGKTSGNFQAGYASDDTNPLPGLDLAADVYTELEFDIEPVSGLVTNGEVYEFALYDGEYPLDVTSDTPVLTIGTPVVGYGFPFTVTIPPALMTM